MRRRRLPSMTNKAASVRLFAALQRTQLALPFNVGGTRSLASTARTGTKPPHVVQVIAHHFSVGVISKRTRHNRQFLGPARATGPIIDHVVNMCYYSFIDQLVNTQRDPSAALSLREAHRMLTKQTTKVKVSPLADRVVVKALDDGEQMRGGLYIPDTAKEKPQQGEIVAVGPGRFEKDKRVPMDVKVGDKVLYGKYSGNEVTIDGEQLLIIRESDVLAVLA